MPETTKPAVDFDAIRAKRRARAVEEDKRRGAPQPVEQSPDGVEMTAEDLGGQQ